MTHVPLYGNIFNKILREFCIILIIFYHFNICEYYYAELEYNCDEAVF